MSRKASIDWGTVDWDLRDVDIANLVGCSRERVRQVRKEQGRGRSPLWHKRVGTSYDVIEAMDTSSMTPEQVAKEVDCSEAYVLQVLRSLGKKFVKPPDGRCKHKYAWDSIKPREWQELTDAAIAEKLGVENPAVVTQWRRRKGIVKKKKSTEVEEPTPVPAKVR